MARDAIGYGTRRGRQAKQTARPAPIGGLNGRDAKGVMPATDAYELDNWFPLSDGCISRKGRVEHATGLGGDVETLAVYDGGDGSPQLLGFADGSIFDATTAGAVGTAITTGRTVDRVYYTMFSNAGAQFLVGVNGADTPFKYDGSTYGALTITGVTGSQNNLAYVHSYKKRLYFAAVGELGFYYLASEAIQGAATYFDLSQIFRRGGYLMSIGSLSQSAGNGPDDLIFFISSRGELVVYAGSDPDDATNWSLVGTYHLGEPIGRRCIIKYGGDSLVITTMGLLPVSVLFQEDDPSPTENALSYKLGSKLTDYFGNVDEYGWHCELHPRSQMLIMNVPDGGSFVQFVMNTITGAWCRFIGWEAISFAQMEGSLYYGAAGGIIMQADTGTTDETAPIKINAKQAYDRFEDFNNKHWLNARLKLEYVTEPPLDATFNVDYVENVPVYVGETITASNTDWDVPDWDEEYWDAGSTTQSKWIDINQVGFMGSMWVRGEVSLEQLKWFETEHLYTIGGPMV